jgi:hypothetical protein
LRLALAERCRGAYKGGAPEADSHVADLAARFDTARLRGDTIHRREEARFQLDLMHLADEALTLAQANWTVQREPADALILLEAAEATGRPDAALPVLAWYRGSHIEDSQIAGLIARLYPERS